MNEGISRDGRFAFVAEILQPRPNGATRLDQMPSGSVIRSVDLHTLGEREAIIDVVNVGTQPQSIELNPAGDLIVAVTTDTDRELSFVPVDNGRFGTVTRFGLDLPPADARLPLKSTWVRWHPSGDYIAVNLVDRSQVAFYQVVRDSAGVVEKVIPWGNRVQVNKFPFIAHSLRTVSSTSLRTFSGAWTRKDSMQSRKAFSRP